MGIEVNQKGFTLVEILVVTAIIGILVMIVVPQYSLYRNRTYNSSCMADLGHLKTGMEAFKIEHEGYPAVLVLQ
jgi:type IV pilus assembly protein PilA